MQAEADGGDDEPITSAADWQVACIGDGTTGDRVQAVYAYEVGTPSRYDDVAPYIRAYAAATDLHVSEAAAETGGQRRVRYVTDQCTLDVLEVGLSSDAVTDFDSTIVELSALGLERSDRKYVVWFDTAVSICGIAQVYADDRPGQDNRNNHGPQYARIDGPCWDYAETHELIHVLGAVQPSAPHATTAGHCTDEHDVMCYDDGTGAEITVQCSDAPWYALDCGFDDYFHVAPDEQAYLGTHWNVADSAFLSESATTASSRPDLVVPADFDGDGKDEVMVYVPDTGQVDVHAATSVGGGDGIINSHAIATGWDVLTAGDFDGDGRDELSFYRASDGFFTTYAMTTKGSLGSRLHRRTIASGWTEIVAGDFDGDGRDQLTFYHEPDGRFASYQVQHDGRLGERTELRTDLATGWSSLSSGDFNDNGRGQLLFYRAQDGRLVTYLVGHGGELTRRVSRRSIATGWTSVEATDQARPDGDLVAFHRSSDRRLSVYSTKSGGALDTRVHLGSL